MRKWKRIIAFLAATSLLAVFVGCGSDKKESENTKEAGKKVEQEREKLVYTNKEPLSLWKSEEDMPFYDKAVTDQAVSTITPYIADVTGTAGCVIICPGGGYQQLATEKEGTIPAEAFNENGISAFVLQYRVTPYTYEAILSDVCRAVRYVRYYAEDFGIDPDKIAVMGFSAGGHLAAMELEHNEEDTQSNDEIDKVSAKADCGILCYPVLSLEDPYAHKGSRERFLGENSEDEELRKKYSAELGVTNETPPCFVWHCMKDTTVPYQNSQMFADAMNAAGVECNLSLYEWGAHGLGLALDNRTEVKDWFPNCVTWLKGRGY